MDHVLSFISTTGIPVGIIVVVALVVWELNHTARISRRATKQRLRRNSLL
jgi:hypothetical protein